VKALNIIKLVTLVILALLGACKFDMSYEIWLNADDSGKARMETSVSLPKMEGTMDIEDTITNDNSYSEMAQLIEETEGAELIGYDYKIDQTETEMIVTYFIDFTFNNVQTLQKVIIPDYEEGIRLAKKGKDKELSIDAMKLTIDAENQLQEYLSFLDMNMKIKLNLPSPAKSVDPAYEGLNKQKELSWDFHLDDEWADQESHTITITY
jgi:hypothetical protein